ncbi:hypothetical protein GCM10023224_40350 [Streptomonospora halophila]|uniref:Uncharacterized protein n=1 Tax=Streptomonospora halophila TaxID=427369 RepID=A0ABP9GT61_9ACTN
MHAVKGPSARGRGPVSAAQCRCWGDVATHSGTLRIRAVTAGPIAVAYLLPAPARQTFHVILEYQVRARIRSRSRARYPGPQPVRRP